MMDSDPTTANGAPGLLVVHLTETDGDPKIQGPLTMAEAQEYIKAEGLTGGDYAVVRGYVVKDFTSDESNEESERAEYTEKSEWDFDAYSKYTEAMAPHVKLRIRWPDGGAETPWGRHLGDDYYMMDNAPLYPAYRYGDVVRAEDGLVTELVYRPFPIKLVFLYTEGDDPEVRKPLAEAVKEHHGFPGFFTRGEGYALLREGTNLTAVKASLLATGIEVIEVQVQDFDIETDKYSYSEV